MSHSSELWGKAQIVIPGGVNSPVRAFRNVKGTPIFFKAGQGPFLFDVDNTRYIDYVGSWGPLILGHAHPAVIAAVQTAAAQGLSFGAPTPIEVEMATTLTRLVPSIEQVRLVSSGTEATQSAIRLARGFTKRHKILKFEGCYHGHSDSLLVKAGSGCLTFGQPDSAGVPPEFAAHTITIPFNDVEAAERIFSTLGNDLAAVIVEPIVANMNCVLPLPGFLSKLRALCTQYGSLLIFDEVITGFRVDLHCAQGLYKIKPDLTCLGKIIGGGLPVGAFGGRRDVMEYLSPLGPVYQAGTLSGNPVTLSAGLATLKELEKEGVYKGLHQTTQSFIQSLNDLATHYNIPFKTHTIGSLFGLFFTEEHTITQYSDVAKSNIAHFTQFFHGMLKEGVYFAPSAFECGFVSTAHTPEVIDYTLEAAQKVFQKWTMKT
jgi:glutamate-1-semialdehyde 2,1-aminomutase